MEKGSEKRKEMKRTLCKGILLKDRRKFSGKVSDIINLFSIAETALL
jgi:hypothetical protein